VADLDRGLHHAREDLASHGYFVVGFDAPYRTSLVVLPDNRIIERRQADNPENLSADEANRLINKLLPMWTTDTRFVVNQLQQLNSTDASGQVHGTAGYAAARHVRPSFGGATAFAVLP